MTTKPKIEWKNLRSTDELRHELFSFYQSAKPKLDKKEREAYLIVLNHLLAQSWRG